MKVVFVIGDPKKNLLARLTSMFTQCPAYHVGFLDEETNMFYDMYWLRRRRKWPRYDDNKCVMFDVPEVTREFLEEKLSIDDSSYGVVDYLMFGLRPIFHLFGKTTKNAGGMICSEMVNCDIIDCGGKTPFSKNDSPPSPCDLLRWFSSK